MYSEPFFIPAWVLWTCQVVLGASIVLTMIRVILGPSTPDRLLALDLLASLTMGQAILLVFMSQFISYLDIASAIAVVSFLATVAFSRYLEKQEKPI